MRLLSGAQTVGLVWLVLGVGLVYSPGWLGLLISRTWWAWAWLGLMVALGLIGLGVELLRRPQVLAWWLGVSFVVGCLTSSMIMFNTSSAGVALAAPYLAVAFSSCWDALAVSRLVPNIKRAQAVGRELRAHRG